jgi:ppGpp synthetase/RelA/SpoT-type nucleotidyltranferase
MTELSFAQFEEHYDTHLKKRLREARELLDTRVRQLLENTPAIERQRLVESRVKTARSVFRKMQAWGLPLERIPAEMHDLVGCRVVCHHERDARRIAHAVEKLGGDIRCDAAATRDLIARPLRSGYRAIHLIVAIRLDDGPEVLAEVQVRTVIQDAWAVLTHDDVYKRRDVPPLVDSMFLAVARQLDAAQETVDALRRELHNIDVQQRRYVLPLVVDIDRATVQIQLRTLSHAIDALKYLIEPQWRTYFDAHLQQKFELGRNIDYPEVARTLDKLRLDDANREELRFAALLARADLVDKGYPGEELLAELRTAVTQKADTRTMRSLQAMAWLRIGELERHFSRWDEAEDAYSHRDIPKPLRLHRIALVHRMRNDEARSLRTLDDAARARPQADRLTQGAIHRDRGIHFLRKYQHTLEAGDLNRAEEDLKLAESLLETTIDVTGYRVTQVKLARIAIFRRDFAHARGTLVDALAELRKTGHRVFIAMALADLSRLSVAEGGSLRDVGRCVTELTALTVADSSDGRPQQIRKWLAQSLWYRGELRLMRGRRVEAIQDFLQDLALNATDPVERGRALHGVVRVLAQYGVTGTEVKNVSRSVDARELVAQLALRVTAPVSSRSRARRGAGS